MRSLPLSALELENFKCFRRQRLKFGNLTVLAGLNGTGKSSVIQALLLIRQSLSAGRMRRRLLLSDQLVDLGTGADVLFDLADQDELSIVLEFGGVRRTEYRYQYSPESDRLSLMVGSRPIPQATLDVFRNDKGRWVDSSKASRSVTQRIGYRAMFSFRGFQYLSAERHGPRKALPWSEEQVTNRTLGPHGEHVLAFLSEFGRSALEESDPRIKDEQLPLTVEGQVSAWMQEVSPGARLQISRMRDIDAMAARYTYSRKDDVSSRPFRATNVGFGVSYVLPVIVALVAAEANDLIIIENPEAHIHPKGQTKIGQLAARAAQRGAQVVVETHSDHFLDGVRLDARRDRIESENAVFHYFARDGAETTVVTPHLHSDGSLSEWPKGFFDERDNNLLGLLAP